MAINQSTRRYTFLKPLGNNYDFKLKIIINERMNIIREQVIYLLSDIL